MMAASCGGSASRQVYEVEVRYELVDPAAGLRFQSSPPHVYSVGRTTSHLDVDGARCWFPCSDRSVPRWRRDR